MCTLSALPSVQTNLANVLQGSTPYDQVKQECMVLSQRDKTSGTKCGEVPEREVCSFSNQLKFALKNRPDVK